MVEETLTTKLKTEMTEKSVTQMIEAARHDPQKFEDLYLLYVQPVFRYLYSRIRNTPDAEDATAQTFLAALEQIQKYKHDGYFASWLFSIARNKAMDYFRKQRKEAFLNETEFISTDANLLTQVIKPERITALSGLIGKLPEDEQELIRLRYVGELSFAEIGYLFGQKENTVKKSLYRLLARIKVQLEDSHV